MNKYLFFIILILLSCETPLKYHVNGVVKEVDKSKNRLLIDHEEIPGFMDKMVMYFKPAVAIKHYYMPYIYAFIVLSLSISMFISLMFTIVFILIYILARWFFIPIIKSKGISIFLDHPLTIIYMLPVGIVLDFGRLIGIFQGIYFYHLSGNINSKKKGFNSK